MNVRLLFTRFSQGISWNAFFYAVYKTLFTAFSFLLYSFLSTKQFSTWANINSIIFLVLLWTDFGLRKSIARFYPKFSENKKSLKRFVTLILLGQTTILLCTMPIVVYITKNLVTILHLENANFFLYLTAALFICEGLISVLRLIYHAHFWNKQFNLVATAALLAETIANITILITQQETVIILKGVFITKLISGAAITLVGLGWLPKLYKDSIAQDDHHRSVDFPIIAKDFVKHSLIMWINNNLKSLSERNYLVPFFTYIFGAPVANLFKIANDGALFFYRIVLKTIGINDTALLAHVMVNNNDKKLLPIVFKKLTTQIAALCIPVLGILLVLLVQSSLIITQQFVFQIFFIMAIGYIIELILSPYERVLEVNQRYLLLMCAYMPYIIMLLLAYYFSSYITYIGLVWSVMIIHGVRLVSSLLMVHYTNRYYRVSFPTRFVLRASLICLVGIGCIGVSLYYISPYYNYSGLDPVALLASLK